MQRDWWWYCSDWTCERFSFWATPGFELVTSGSIILYSTNVPWQLLVFTSNSFRYLTLAAEGLVVVLLLIGPVRDILFGHTEVWTGDLWISSPALYHCAMANSGFSPLRVSGIYLWCRGIDGGIVSDWTCERFSFWATPGFEPGISGSLVQHSTSIPWQLLVFTSDNFRYLTLVQRDWWWYYFWLDLWEIIFLGHTGVWTRDLWIYSPALYHCAMATSGFYLWQFQVFKSGAEGLMVVLYWLDLWEIFFLAKLGFEPGTSGSIVLHSTNMPWQLLDFTSDNFRYLPLVQRDFWWYCSDWTCERFSFLATLWFEPWTSGSLVLHSTTVPWQLLVFTSDNFRYLTLVQRDWCWYCSDWTFERFPFLDTLVFEPGTSASLVLHSTTVPWQLLVFTSDNFRYLTLVKRDWWWYCSDWTFERFSFWATLGLWTGHFWISNHALYQCALATSGFHLWLFQVFKSGAEGLMVILYLIGPVRDFLFGPLQAFEPGYFWITSHALYQCAMATSGFHL